MKIGQLQENRASYSRLCVSAVGASQQPCLHHPSSRRRRYLPKISNSASQEFRFAAAVDLRNFLLFVQKPDNGRFAARRKSLRHRVINQPPFYLQSFCFQTIPSCLAKVRQAFCKKLKQLSKRLAFLFPPQYLCI